VRIFTQGTIETNEQLKNEKFLVLSQYVEFVEDYSPHLKKEEFRILERKLLFNQKRGARIPLVFS
jgi:hypothetical protein